MVRRKGRGCLRLTSLGRLQVYKISLEMAPTLTLLNKIQVLSLQYNRTSYHNAMPKDVSIVQVYEDIEHQLRRKKAQKISTKITGENFHDGQLLLKTALSQELSEKINPSIRI